MLLDSSCDFTSHFKATSPVMAMQDWFEAGSVASGGSASTSKPHPQQTSSLQEFVIDDAVYGRHVIQEAALIELIQCPAVQRLKQIYQHGITAVIGMCTEAPLTRYEHSVGAMLLLRTAGAPLEAQAAALLHDVAHTALSHVADCVYGYVVHEDDKMEYLSTTSLLDILDRHFGVQGRHHILEEENFPLLERDAPKLCADRMDYALRDSIQFGTLSLTQARAIYQDFSTYKAEFVCSTAESARLLSTAYMRCDQVAWANPAHSSLYKLAANAIRLALERQQLCKADLWRLPCSEFWSAFVHSSDPDVRRAASLVSPRLHVERCQDQNTELGGDVEADEGWIFTLSPKLRTIDPDVLVRDQGGQGTGTKTLSQLDGQYKAARDAYIAEMGAPIKYRATLPASQ